MFNALLHLKCIFRLCIEMASFSLPTKAEKSIRWDWPHKCSVYEINGVLLETQNSSGHVFEVFPTSFNNTLIF